MPLQSNKIKNIISATARKVLYYFLLFLEVQIPFLAVKMCISHLTLRFVPSVVFP
jgi:hypothetical protein